MHGEAKGREEEVKRLLESLGAAIREQVRASDRIREILSEIEARGYDVSLTLGINLGQSSPSEKPESLSEAVIGPEPPEKGPAPRKFSAFDRRFLRALRIRSTG